MIDRGDASRTRRGAGRFSGPSFGMSRRTRRRDELVAALAVLMLVVVRMTAPDDGWDHAQPRTMAYAVDMAAGGSLILPQDAEGLPSTKPPLHPWLAAPAVRLAGPGSWLAHRWPDIAAAAGVAIALVLAGRRWWPRSGGQVGAVAATMWITSLTGAKTALLARPDMLLTAAVTIAWITFVDAVLRAARATDARDRGPLASGPPRAVRGAGAWPWLVASAVAAGGLAKGPGVLVVVPGFLLAAWWIGPPAWSALRRLGHPGVIAVAILPPVAWLAAAAAIDPGWVIGELLHGEVLNRIAGTMDETESRGTGRLVQSALYMPTYLLLRFLPWTVPLLLAGVLIRWPRASVRPRPRVVADAVVPVAALAMVVGVVLVFSLSAGKRADYLAPCLPAAAIAAAWWMVRGDRRVHGRAPWAVPLAAAVLLLLQAAHLRRPSNGVSAAFGPAVAEIASRAREMAAAQDLRVLVLGGGGTSLPLRLGRVPADPPSRFGELVAEGRPFLMAHATLGPTPIDGVRWAAAHPRVRAASAIVERFALPRHAWTERDQAAGERGGEAEWAVWLVLVEPQAAGANGLTGPVAGVGSESADPARE